MRDKDREAEQDYWDIHPEEEKEHIEKAKAEGEPMLILNEKVVWVNKDYSKLKNVNGKNTLYILKSCKNVIKSIERQIYKEGTHIPDKDSGYDHMNDALGYLIDYIKPLVIQNKKSTPIRWAVK